MNPAYIEALIGHRVTFTLVGINLGPVDVVDVTSDKFVNFKGNLIVGQNFDGSIVRQPGVGKIAISSLVGFMDFGPSRNEA